MTRLLVTVSTASGIQVSLSNLTTFQQSKVYLVLYGEAANADISEGLERGLSAVCSSTGSSYEIIEKQRDCRLTVINEVLDSENLLSGDDPIILIDEIIQIMNPLASELIKSNNPDKLMINESQSLFGSGEIGITGVCTTSSDSPDQNTKLTKAEVSAGMQEYAGRRMAWFAGQHLLASWVDGTLCALWPCMRRIVRSGKLLDESLGDYAWRDLSIRAQAEGLRTTVSQAGYATRVDGKDCGPETIGNVNNRIKFYSKHESSRKNSVTVIYRVALTSVNDLATFKASIQKSSSLSESIIVVLKNNPLEVQLDPEYKMVKSKLGGAERTLLQSCDNAQKEDVEKAFMKWVSASCSRKMKSCIVFVGMSGNDSNDINQAINLSEKLGSDAVLILDHDEVLEDQFDEQQIQLALSHPDPMVLGFDFTRVYHWDSPTLVRTGSPYGAGADYRGAPSSARLFRKVGKKFSRCNVRVGEITDIPTPTVPEASVAILNARIRSFALIRPQDRIRAGINESQENMTVSTYGYNNSIGFHFLCYENEDPDDVARWLSLVYAFTKERVMVWTGEWDDSDMVWLSDSSKLSQSDWFDSGPSRALAIVCRLFDCKIVYRPLNDHLAEARNAGIDTLSESNNCKWALFVDPDEWFANDQSDLKTIRSMSASDRVAYLFKIANFRSNSREPTISDTIRMTRLESAYQMRMNGRVHESFDLAIKSLEDRGIHGRIMYAPFTMLHRGLSFDASVMNDKLEKYERLIRMELSESPKNPGAWVSLGWHYLNEDCEEEANECFQNALDCAGDSYLPFKEVAFTRLRESRKMIRQCLDRLTPGHQFYDICKQMDNWLTQYAPPHPKVERGRTVEVGPVPKYKLDS